MAWIHRDKTCGYLKEVLERVPIQRASRIRELQPFRWAPGLTHTKWLQSGRDRMLDCKEPRTAIAADRPMTWLCRLEAVLSHSMLSPERRRRSSPAVRCPGKVRQRNRRNVVLVSPGTWHLSPRLSTVFVLRCTQKLLDRLNSTPDSELAPPDTVLGDWYANLIRIGRIQVVLAVSERSLLPVVLPARDGRALVQRLCETLEPMLTSIGVPADEVTAERDAMQHWAVGKTANRRVLGSLNDLAFQLQVGLLNFPDRTLLAQSLWLAKTPLKVIDHGAPKQATLAAFAAHRTLQAVIGR